MRDISQKESAICLTTDGSSERKFTWMGPTSAEEELDKKRMELIEEFTKKKEAIDHPQHYGGDTVYETIKVIEAWGLGFHLGNAVKYISRSKSKGSELEDLKKARWYLDRLIELKEKNENLSVG
jgi:hypothetical protein